MIERDSRLCPMCASRSPFGYECPACLRPIARDQMVCSGCGRPLATTCPFCAKPVFAGSEKCEWCGQSLMIRCESKRCGNFQFFENVKCTACGKPIKKGAQQIDARRKEMK
ncbi:MAG: zinc ribbon domain-containing protein [Actinomycetia bacterium]|nr:zinc ribbon domain-containing protein [Actinomycetes bacterium]